ncbi:MAG: prolipoprotein diacylglyceryl transferase [Candidatus Anoxymicrobium japonicum]|uniref:Phosphatidylglycerol--prolipoprotein diacylglyceryl transferase n=1 Tax=Candidatus Anoxymicrobium japonicum TaxID=2013648 RepID=A0A2N3G6B5_9ACTN|nr:MAG: prolipoprotein diacylglyceryl transferase [Candidatus Anoxymicrobium japonicum]
MHREMFHIGNLTVYSYGVMLAVGFLVAALVARRHLSRQYKDPDLIFDFMLAAVVGGILGARLFYVAGYWSYYSSHMNEIIKVNMDGLVFYGGLIFGLAFGVLVGRWKKIKFWTTMDLAGLCVPLALAIGRIGCFLNGCCYGKPTGMAWGVSYPAVCGIVGRRHPAQIYELILDLALFAFLWWKKDEFVRDGTAFWVFVMGYSAIRFSMEFFREHASASAGPFFQFMSIGLFVVAVAVLLFRHRILPPAGSETL